ncbi:MAG: hypothetical protein Q7T82_13295 [Armatimonadota bacterium]|nr:hypothetical protein [Armatimonadota bacterium]
MPAGSIDYVQIGKVAGVGGIAFLVFAEIIKKLIPSLKNLTRKQKFILSLVIAFLAFLALVVGQVTYIIVKKPVRVDEVYQRELRGKTVDELETELHSSDYPSKYVVQALARKYGEEKTQAEEVLAGAIQDERENGQVVKQALTCLAPRLTLNPQNRCVANALAHVYWLFSDQSSERQLVDRQLDRIWLTETNSHSFENALCRGPITLQLARLLALFLGDRYVEENDTAARQVMRNCVNSPDASPYAKDACRDRLQ